MNDSSRADTHSQVQRYYGETLSSSQDLKTTACCTVAAPPAYIREAMAGVHTEVSDKYYGCGLVLPEALEGLRVLDLGCGAGRDVYILSRLVGPTGRVVGVDMTPAQLAVAEQYREWHARAYQFEESNVEFIEANIEHLDQTALADESFDLIISNCVINLAVDKEAVLRSACRLLSPGGEMYFSDIYADRRIPAQLARDPVLYGECLSGALYWADFMQLARQTGFMDPRLVEFEPVAVTDPELAQRTGELAFTSATCRLAKVADLESSQEDYGQRAVYLGTVAEHPDSLRLDHATVFTKGEEVRVSGNTARILSCTRFRDHFTILGDYSLHLGDFGSIANPDLFTKTSAAETRSSCC